MKSVVKRLLRRVGFELHRFSVEDSENGRLITMLNYHKVNLILDVGANAGQFGILLRDSGFIGKIVSFEPLSDAIKELIKISKKDHLWEIAPRTAIGQKNGEIEIQISGNSQSSSILNMMDTHVKAAPESKYIDKEKVALKKLDSIAPNYMDKNSIVFLKIDTQGYENKVINGAEKLMNKIIGVQIEMSLVPLYEDQILFEEMFKKMKSLGFELWAISSVFSDPNSAQLLQIDATFFRTKNKNF